MVQSQLSFLYIMNERSSEITLQMSLIKLKDDKEKNISDSIPGLELYRTHWLGYLIPSVFSTVSYAKRYHVTVI